MLTIAWTAKPHRNVRLFKYLAQWIANIASQVYIILFVLYNKINFKLIRLTPLTNMVKWDQFI